MRCALRLAWRKINGNYTIQVSAAFIAIVIDMSNRIPGFLQNKRHVLPFVVLAPSASVVPESFRHVSVDSAQHLKLTVGLQLLRGHIYLEDGAVEQHQLTAAGRHRQIADSHSWQVLIMDEREHVAGCARYLEYRGAGVSFEQLGVSYSALARSEDWGNRLRRAINLEVAAACQEDLAYAEVGGWALSGELRYTSAALRIALGIFGLAQLLGGCLALTTATIRHSSSSMLRRLGGKSLEVDGLELPAYYDPQYKCQMEVLRFRSDDPKPRYWDLLNSIKADLLCAPVICRTGGTSYDFQEPLGTTIQPVSHDDWHVA